jgi:hypothetical protein
VGRGLVIETDADHGDRPTAERQPTLRSVPPSTVRNVQHHAPLLFSWLLTHARVASISFCAARSLRY